MTTENTNAGGAALRDAVAQHLDRTWAEFAREHPNLAATIDRARLVESAVASLRGDPEFVAAMKQADMDEAQLAAAARLLGRLDKLMRRLIADI